MTLGWILGASVAGGALSVALAALALYLRASWIRTIFILLEYMYIVFLRVQVTKNELSSER